MITPIADLKTNAKVVMISSTIILAWLFLFIFIYFGSLKKLLQELDFSERRKEAANYKRIVLEEVCRQKLKLFPQSADYDQNNAIQTRTLANNESKKHARLSNEANLMNHEILQTYLQLQII